MLDLPQAVTAAVMLHLQADDAIAEIQGALGYDPADPYAVTLTIGTEAVDAVTWTFARELLADGVRQPAGLGDVTVEPANDFDERLVRITLANESVASMTMRQADVVEFLCASYTLVPSGCELDSIDLDAAIAELLA